MTLLQLIAERAKSYGVRLAGDYLREIQACLADGSCPAKVFELADPGRWQEAIKSADSRLTYSDHESVVLGTYGAEAIKAAKTAEGVSPLAVFEGVSTSRRKDRDRDVMEPGGATVDEAHPLLWQHMPFQPLGKHLGVTKQTEEQVANKWAIYDVGNGLGMDAAKLVEVQALRLSIGFDVEEYEQLREKDGRFHIKKFEVVETSLVSVPSNVDAVITLYSREKLRHPAVKGWAKGLHDGRSTTVKSGVAFDAAGRVDKDGGASGSSVATTEAPGAKANGCTCGSGSPAQGTSDPAAKSHQGGERQTGEHQTGEHQAGVEKMYVGPGAFVGSFEWIRWKLGQQTRLHLNLSDDDYAYIDYTYADHAILCVYKRDESREFFLKVGWSMVEGEPTWTGEPKEVELDVVIKPVDNEKRRAEKAGRVISRKNETSLKEAREKMEESIKYIKMADSKIGSVISGSGDTGGDDDDDDDEDDEMEEKLRKAGEVVMATPVECLSQLHTLKRVVALAIEALEAEEMEELFRSDD